MLGWLKQQWQSKKTKWVARQEATLYQEFAPRLTAVRAMYEQTLHDVASQTEQAERQQRELTRLRQSVTDAEGLLQDRQVALQKASEELRQQLRLLEAKASPDSVWVFAFSQGYSKAWDTMLPVMSYGLERTLEKIRTDTIEKTLKDINPLRPQHELLLKQRDFELKQKAATVEGERQKYQHYLEALSWALNGYTLH